MAESPTRIRADSLEVENLDLGISRLTEDDDFFQKEPEGPGLELLEPGSTFKRPSTVADVKKKRKNRSLGYSLKYFGMDKS